MILDLQQDILHLWNVIKDNIKRVSKNVDESKKHKVEVANLCQVTILFLKPTKINSIGEEMSFNNVYNFVETQTTMLDFIQNIFYQIYFIQGE